MMASNATTTPAIPPEGAAGVDLKSGPFSVLYNAVRGNTQILVNVRNNHKLLARVKAYDRHMNLYVGWLFVLLFFDCSFSLDCYPV